MWQTTCRYQLFRELITYLPLYYLPSQFSECTKVTIIISLVRECGDDPFYLYHNGYHQKNWLIQTFSSTSVVVKSASVIWLWSDLFCKILGHSPPDYIEIHIKRFLWPLTFIYLLMVVAVSDLFFHETQKNYCIINAFLTRLIFIFQYKNRAARTFCMLLHLMFPRAFRNCFYTSGAVHSLEWLYIG